MTDPKKTTEIAIDRVTLGPAYDSVKDRWLVLAQTHEGEITQTDEGLLIRFTYGPEFDESVFSTY